MGAQAQPADNHTSVGRQATNISLALWIAIHVILYGWVMTSPLHLLLCKSGYGSDYNGNYASVTLVAMAVTIAVVTRA